MPDFALLHTDDPLGLATAGDIVLTEVNEVLNHDLVDILSEQAVPIPDSAKLIRGIHTLNTSYELRSSDLVIPLGVDVGLNNYRVSSIRASHNSEGYPTVSITAVKPEFGTFHDTPGSYDDVTVTGGFGMVELWGGTCDAPLSSSCNISSQQAVAVAGTDGKIMTAGIVLYAYRKEATLEGYSVVAIPASGQQTSEDERKGREGWNIVARGWTDYLVASE